MTILKGFEPLRGRPPIAIPRITLNGIVLEGLKKSDLRAEVNGGLIAPVSLTVEQYRGRFMVNKYSLLYLFHDCPPPPETKTDHVVFTDKIPPQRALTLAPGRLQKGCVDYDGQVYESTALQTVNLVNHRRDDEFVNAGPFSPPPSTRPVPCHSEVVVFSKDNALAVVQPVSPAWEDPVGDRVPVSLPSTLTVPVTAWFIYDSTQMMGSNVNQAIEDLRNDLSVATTAFTHHSDPALPATTLPKPMCGIQFPNLKINTIDMDKLLKNSTGVLTIKNGRTKEDFIEVGNAPGDAEVRYKEDIDPPLYEPAHLNLYVLWNPDMNPGETVRATNSISCAVSPGPNCDPYGDMILLRYADRPPTTVAHEIGHTLSLEHTAFNAANLMQSGTRSGSGMELTRGQCYRTHVDFSSYVNTDGIRPTGPQLTNCPRGIPNPSATYTMCPDLTFDYP